MIILFALCRIVSIVAFLGFGVLCLVSPRMVDEFKRYGLEDLRIITGILEVAGALGLLASYRLPALAPYAAGGLALLMTCGVITRIRIQDPFLVMVPAIALGVINGLIVWLALSGRAGAPTSP